MTPSGREQSQVLDEAHASSGFVGKLCRSDGVAAAARSTPKA